MQEKVLEVNNNQPWKIMIIRLVRRPNGIVGGVIMLLLIFTAVFAPLLSPYPYDKINTGDSLEAPSLQHLFGTDRLGRDLFSRVISGAPMMLQVGFVALFIALVGGLTIGLLGGYLGGWVDRILMAGVEVLLSFPTILLAFLILYILGPGFGGAMLAVGISAIPAFARVVRGQVLKIKHEEYVLAAIACGIPNHRILWRTILPNVLTPVIVLGSVLFSEAVLAAAGLAFIGLGAQPPSPDWGTLIVDGRAYMSDAPWLLYMPGLAIFLTVLGSNLLGSALREILSVGK